MLYEYIVTPAPVKIARARKKATAAERLADTLTIAINEMAVDGWEYLRTETMTVEDKKSRFAKVEEVIETVLVFRRAVGASGAATAIHNNEDAYIEPDRQQAAPEYHAENPAPAPREQRRPRATTSAVYDDAPEPEYAPAAHAPHEGTYYEPAHEAQHVASYDDEPQMPERADNFDRDEIDEDRAFVPRVGGVTRE